MYLRRSKLLLMVLVFVSFLPVYGDEVEMGSDDFMDISLEELVEIDVSSAGFFTTTTNKAPGTIMVYDMEDINNAPIRTLSDLFDQYIPGAISGAHERQGRLVGTRGLMIDNNAKTLVMWDGQQINYRSHFGYMVGMLSPFMGDMSKVEVIHGPGAIMHGSGAINGFVNMVPKTGMSHPGGFLNYEYGIREQSNLFEAGYGFQYGEKRGVYVYGGKYRSKGFDPDENWGTTKEYAGDVNAFGFEENNYRVSTTWNHDNFSLNFFTYDLHPMKNSLHEYGYFMNETMAVRPKYILELTDTESVEMSASFLWMDFGDIGANGQTANVIGGSESHWDTKAVFKTTRFDNHQLAVGGLFGKKRFRGDKFYFSADPPEGFESLDTMWEESSLFAEDVFTVTDSLTLSFGIRYDKYHLDPIHNMAYIGDAPDPEPGKIPGHTSPRFALAYEIDSQTVVKASYQHGFRMPDAAYYNWNEVNNTAASGLGFSNSPALKPEEMDSYELNLYKVLTNKLNVNANVYYNVFKDQLTWGNLENYWSDDEIAEMNDWTPASSWGWEGGMFQNNEGDYAVYGTELMVDYDVAENANLEVSYGYAKAENNVIEQHYPPHLIKTRLDTKWLENKLIVSLNHVYNSSFSKEINPIMDDLYDSYRSVFNLAASYQMTDNFRIKAQAHNIFGDAVPPASFRSNVPQWGNAGYGEPRYYLSAELTF